MRRLMADTVEAAALQSKIRATIASRRTDGATSRHRRTLAHRPGECEGLVGENSNDRQRASG